MDPHPKDHECDALATVPPCPFTRTSRGNSRKPQATGAVLTPGILA